MEARLAEASRRAESAESKGRSWAEDQIREAAKKAQHKAGNEFTASKRTLEEVDGLRQFQKEQQIQSREFRESSDQQREKALKQARDYHEEIGLLSRELSRELRSLQEPTASSQGLIQELQEKVNRQNETMKENKDLQQRLSLASRSTPPLPRSRTSSPSPEPIEATIKKIVAERLSQELQKE